MDEKLRTEAANLARLLVEDMGVGNPREVHWDEFSSYSAKNEFVREGDFNFEIEENIFEISYGIRSNGEVVYVGFLDDHKDQGYFDKDRLEGVLI